MDKGIVSPFSNSRTVKPLVDIVGPETFVSFDNLEDRYVINYFELVKGGINMKI